MMAGNQYSVNQSGSTVWIFRKHHLYLCLWTLMNIALVQTSNTKGRIVGYNADSGNILLLNNNNNNAKGVDLIGTNANLAEYAKMSSHHELADSSLYQDVPQSSQTHEERIDPDTYLEQPLNLKAADNDFSEENPLPSQSHSHMHRDVDWAQGHMRGKQSDDSVLEKRKWTNKMSAWGKRGLPSLDDGERLELNPDSVKNSFNHWEKKYGDYYAKKWANINAWGKRWASPYDDKERYENENNDNKRWSKSMNAWGKRDDDDVDEYALDKRWSNKMNAWGKRGGLESGSDNRIDSWGGDSLENDKRWSKSMSAWGKRGNDDDAYYDKKWAKSMNAWGKRDENTNSNTDIDKRWAKTMSAWGKRDPSTNEDIENDKRWAKAMNAWGKHDGDKRWSSSMNAWGKRDILLQDAKPDKQKRWSNSMNFWGKRWSNSMKAWGKRDAKRWSGAMNAWGKRGPVDDADKARFRRWSFSRNSVNSQEPEDFHKSYQTLKHLQDSIGEHSAEHINNHDLIPNNGDDTNSSNGRQYDHFRTLENAYVPSKRSWMPSNHYWRKRTNFPYFGGPKRGWQGHDLNVWG